MNALSVRDLRKSYGDIEAVKGISFDVETGSFLAFLGPNGAGKSTTISTIVSLLEPDSGTVKVFGKSPKDSRPDIGVVFQDPKMDPLLTVRENISVRGSMYGMKGKGLADAVDSAIVSVGASEYSDRRYGQLSGGQRRRADIARAIVHSPRLLILDEPTTGLDPVSRNSIWELIHNLNRDRNITVILTTHYMEEAKDADTIIIIDKGEIAVSCTPAELRDRYCHDSFVFVSSDPERSKSILDSAGAVYSHDGRNFRVELAHTSAAIPLIESLKGDIESMEVRSGTLDEAFIKITGGEE